MYCPFLYITSLFVRPQLPGSCASVWAARRWRNNIKRMLGITGFEQWVVWHVRNNYECCQMERYARARPRSRGTLPLWSCAVDQAQKDAGYELDGQEGLGSSFGVRG